MPKRSSSSRKPLPCYEPGQSFTGTVRSADVGGYRLAIPKDPRLGYLPSEHVFQRGERISVCFVAADGDRILVAAAPNVEMRKRPRMLRGLVPVKLLFDAYQAFHTGEFTKAYELALSMSTDPGAQCLLGRLFEEGLGVKKDYQEAFDWYKLSAQQGVIEAQTKLTLFYENGIGTKKNPVEAEKWRQLAAES